MDSIPPDVAKKLLNRDFANLVKRVQADGCFSFYLSQLRDLTSLARKPVGTVRFTPAFTSLFA